MLPVMKKKEKLEWMLQLERAEHLSAIDTNLIFWDAEKALAIASAKSFIYT